MSVLPTSGTAPKLYLLDIEGTVAPLSLTSSVLFPYARAHFEEFLRRVAPELESLNPGDAPAGTIFADMMMLVRENQAETDPSAPRILPLEAATQRSVSISLACGVPRVLEYVYWLMDRDRKSTALKSLQGKIWKAGFESGELKGTLFEDVPEAFVRWARNARIAIYSSGSVEAQELLFRHSVFGDLTGFLSNYFDTRIGAKVDSASYGTIADAMHFRAEDVLFLSDTVKELDAAREAGCGTRLVARAGNVPVTDAHGHAVVESFARL